MGGLRLLEGHIYNVWVFCPKATYVRGWGGRVTCRCGADLQAEIDLSYEESCRELLLGLRKDGFL